jgi:hypothetical protein
MIDPLMRKAADQPLTEADIEAACRYLALTRGALFDSISRRVVQGYSSGELDFGFCDGVMNQLYGTLMTWDEPMPNYTYSVFFAFDEGEYHHQNDPEGSSPEDLYTKPMIREILASDAQVT